MNAGSTSKAHWTQGQEKCPTGAEDLLVTTGLFGDSTRLIDSTSSLHARVGYAMREQNGWAAGAHAAFWTALLPELPRRGRPSRVDAVSLAVAALMDDGLGHEEACAMAGVEPDTVRINEPDARRGRPSLERGHRLLAERRGPGEADAVGRHLMSTGSMWSPPEALPRVWTDADREPIGDLNLLIDVGWWAPAGAEAGRAAADELKRRWYERCAPSSLPVYSLSESNGDGDEIALSEEHVRALSSGQPIGYAPRDKQLTIGRGGGMVRRESAVPPPTTE